MVIAQSDITMILMQTISKNISGLLILLGLCIFSSFKSDVYERPAAPNFTLDNITGQKVSLSDFKGKVVYIDFWATWCGPCVSEIPHSKKLKEKFAGNDSIVFMYVSVDNEDYIDEWKAFVKKKGMSGVQLIARDGGKEEKVGERYGIQFIPRFVLIDKLGRVAYSEAPAPSSSESEKLIKQLLAE